MVNGAEAHALVESWNDPEVVRRRLRPRPGDLEYLVLEDLREFLGRFATTAPIRVLDYGAGPSPYRSLFPNAEYRRADLVPSEGIDYLLPVDSRLPENIGLFDLVLSTQVAEHLQDPITYFKEAWRVLRPGGTIVITTHGLWEEHGAPYDFQRWTTMGLTRDLEKAGLPCPETYKLTASHRAFLFLTLRWLGLLYSSRSWPSQKATGALRRLAAAIRGPVHRWSDRRMSDLKIAGPKHDNTPALYIVLAAVVRKKNS